MVIVKLDRVAVQVLAKVPETAAVLRHEIEAVVADDNTGSGNTPVKLDRVAVQVLAKVPPKIAVLRHEIEAVVADDNTGSGSTPVKLDRVVIQILAKLTTKVAVLRHEIEAVVSDDNSGSGSSPVLVNRVALTVLSKTPPPGPTPIALPTELAIMLHNWDVPYVLSSDYFTDINPAKTTGSQTRRALRGRPARRMTMSVLDHHEDLDIALTQLRRHTKEQMPVPLSCDAVPVTTSSSGQPDLNCNTQYRRFFPGARIAVCMIQGGRIILPADRDIYTIQVVFGDKLRVVGNLARNYNDSWDVVPLIDCEKTLRIGTAFITDQVTDATLEFDEIVGPSQLNQTAATTPSPAGWPLHHDGLPIFEPQQMGLLQWASPHAVDFHRAGEVALIGRKVRVSPDGPRESQVQDYAFMLERAEFWNLLRFFDSRMGMFLPFFEVDLVDRWTVVLASGSFIEVIPTEGDFDLSFRDVVLDAGYFGLVMNDGITVHIRAIQTILFTGGRWRCTIAGGEPSLIGIDLAQIARAAPARQKQFSSDVLSEIWDTVSLVNVNLTTIETLDNKDLDLS